MSVCFTVIGNIACTTGKPVSEVRAQAKGHFIFKLEEK